MSITRRGLLKAAGPLALWFPFIGRKSQAAASAPPVVLLMQTNGTSQSQFWPSPRAAAPFGSSPILSPLVEDAALAPRTTIIRGLYNHDGGSGNAHDQGFAGLWSGCRTTGTFSNPRGNGVSVDQIIKQRGVLTAPFPTLHCGVLASDTPRFKDHRGSFSYAAPGQPIPTEVDPYKLYSTFFPRLGQSSDEPPDARAAAVVRLRRNKSVLDLVSRDLARLRARLPEEQRHRVELHEEALREHERRLGAALAPRSGTPPVCAQATLSEGLDPTNEDHVPQLIPAMLNFIALAIGCGLTQVVTFQFGSGGEKWYFRWLDINENSHDDIAHRDDGKSPDIAAKLLRINRWYAEQVAFLGRALARLPAATGLPGATLLDDSLVVWGNEQATGQHGLDDIPIVMLGDAGGRLRPGRLVDQGPQDYHSLGTSVLRIVGVEADGFGEAPSCGPVRGLA